MNVMNNTEIFSLEIDEIKQLIEADKISVSVIGIGRIGLPTALSFAKSGFTTIGVDVNEELVNKIKNKNFPLKDEPGYQEIFNQVIDNQKFTATTKIEDAVPNSQIILLSLPTPMDRNNIPDYSALRIVGKQLKDLVSPGSIIIVESTIEPGFIENECVNLIESQERCIKAGTNIGIGVCPETANPGEIMKDFEKLPRLVGATDEKTVQIITEVYKHVFPVELIKMPDCKTANAVKLTTNIFRDINIAFVNELAILFEKLGIDINTVLDAADKKYNFQIHYPGAGVGGPCLPVNSYQMLNSAKEIGDNLLKMVKTGREINEQMPYHVIELLKDALNEGNKQLATSEILILGISYKPNVKDIQLSPAEIIISELQKMGAQIRIFDPYFKDISVYGIQTANNLDDVISKVDAIILVTSHSEFQDIQPEYLASKMKSPILIDTRGVIDIHTAKKAGLIFRGLGRGKI
jgi:nucleotide sugar dehydrogenase